MTVATPKTAPSAPWNLPRSRSGMMSAIRAVAVTVSPPAPRPWSARDAISQVMPWERPHSIEPTMKTVTLIWKTFLRPNWSPTLPITTVTAVWASR